MEGKYLDYTISYPDRAEFLSIKKEIAVEGVYVSYAKEASVIVDIGSHIGLSLLYFMKVFPEANLHAFEPHPKSFEYLAENVNRNGLNSVTLYNCAVTASTSERTAFYSSESGNEWFSNSSLYQGSWTGRERSQEITVESVSVHEVIDEFESIDILKIDVEGYEFKILDAIEDFSKIAHIFVEFHPMNESRLRKVRKILLSGGYKLEFRQYGRVTLAPDRDNLFVIYGYR